MADRANNFIQVFNESVVLVSEWLMFHFTDYVEDPLKRYELGWYFLYFVAVNVIFNVLILFYVLGNKIFVAARRWYLKRKARKLAELRIQAQAALDAKKEKPIVHTLTKRLPLSQALNKNLQQSYIDESGLIIYKPKPVAEPPNAKIPQPTLLKGQQTQAKMEEVQVVQRHNHRNEQKAVSPRSVNSQAAKEMMKPKFEDSKSEDSVQK